MQERVLVIGARRRRQGIGGYVARAFHAAGCNVCAVVGTSIPSATEARDALRDCGINAKAYDDPAAALVGERPDIVAICSPYSVHREHLQLVAEADADCLCEKPLWWEHTTDRQAVTRRLVAGFETRGHCLDVLTQWPQTLPTYRQLFPSTVADRLERFEMRLSPIATGADMVLDAAPHVLSVLWALAGPGEVATPRAEFAHGGRTLKLEFAYHHAAGAVDVTSDFVTCEEQPRPAWYGINGRVAERAIEMPGYRMRLRARDGSGEVPLPDPLPLHVERFVQAVRRGAVTDVPRLVSSVTQLAALHEAASRALELDRGNVR